MFSNKDWNKHEDHENKSQVYTKKLEVVTTNVERNKNKP